MYEYAVIRVVPRVEREEFINVGVILYCREKKFLKTLFTMNEARLLALCAELDLAEVNSYLQAFEQISLGNASCSPIAQLDPASRFRWLTATRSTIIQSSKVHPGLCDDPEAALHRLFGALVL